MNEVQWGGDLGEGFGKKLTYMIPFLFTLLFLTGCDFSFNPTDTIILPTRVPSVTPALSNTPRPTLDIPATATLLALQPSWTPQPSATNTLPPTMTYTPLPTMPPDARVKPDAEGLRLREEPGFETRTLFYLSENSTLSVLGRTADNQWLQVKTVDGLIGWVYSPYVDIFIGLADRGITGEVVILPTSVPPTNAPVVVNPTSPPSNNLPTGPSMMSVSPAAPIPVIISGISANARNIYYRGQNMGNRANVFSKVGDSITIDAANMYPIGNGSYSLGAYNYYQPVINYFSSATLRTGNSFNNVSMAAYGGWKASSVLDPSLNQLPAAGFCSTGEMPLACEYRISRPAFALIMLGTNESLEAVPLDTYRANLQQVVQTTIDHGVVPVLSTLPLLWQHNTEAYNQVVIETARAYDIPLWDYWTAMAGLPSMGISVDAIHPSREPNGQNADFTQFNITNYGFVMRNFTALHVLDAMIHQVIR